MVWLLVVSEQVWVVGRLAACWEASDAHQLDTLGAVCASRPANIRHGQEPASQIEVRHFADHLLACPWSWCHYRHVFDVRREPCCRTCCRCSLLVPGLPLRHHQAAHENGALGAVP